MKRVLAIETSCDETGIAIVSLDNGRYAVISDALNSQVDIHKEFGGVFPMVAKREHGQNLLPLLQICLTAVDGASVECTDDQVSKALSHLEREPELEQLMRTELQNSDSFIFTKPNIDAIAVTAGPGLEPALWVGISFAKALSVLWNKPILPINHMEGHVASVVLGAQISPEDTFPAFALLISGGHTEVVHVAGWADYKVIGKTRDDAVGEAYDKAARILGLSYPGGPEISLRATRLRDEHAAGHLKLLLTSHGIALPRPMMHSKDVDFSFSGLKTAVLYLVRDLKEKGPLTDEIVSLVCYEFEEAVAEVLEAKLTFAKRMHGESKTLIVAGGVIANAYIRDRLDTWCILHDMRCLKPEKGLATDNAIMIGLAALIGTKDGVEAERISARGGWKIDEVY